MRVLFANNAEKLYPLKPLNLLGKMRGCDGPQSVNYTNFFTPKNLTTADLEKKTKKFGSPSKNFRKNTVQTFQKDMLLANYPDL